MLLKLQEKGNHSENQKFTHRKGKQVTRENRNINQLRN